MINFKLHTLIAGLLLFSLGINASSFKCFGTPVKQTHLSRVDLMPDMPSSYEMLDWKTKARKFDAYVYDWHNKGKMGPFIWLDNARRNVDQPTFGLYTAVGDIRSAA